MVQYYFRFQAPIGSLRTYPPWKRGATVFGGSVQTMSNFNVTLSGRPV